MLQPKVHIKSLDLVLPVEIINFHEKTVEVYFNDDADYVPFDFDEVEFMENTGHIDKNGNDIYVGNIVKFHHPHSKNKDEIFLVKKHDFDKKYIISTLFDSCSFDLNGDTIEFVEIIYNMP